MLGKYEGPEVLCVGNLLIANLYDTPTYPSQTPTAEKGLLAEKNAALKGR